MMCKSPFNSLGYTLISLLNNQKALVNTFQATTFKVKENSRTFQGLCELWYPYGRGDSPQPFSENNVPFMDVLGRLEILS